MASSRAALSRTVFVTAWMTPSPPHVSEANGPTGVLARVGLRPNSPQQEAGIRIDPPPSLAPAMGTIPAATAAALPPEEPPLVLRRFQGFFVIPPTIDSVVGSKPSSGTRVEPIRIKPEFCKRSTIVLFTVGRCLANKRDPYSAGCPLMSKLRSFVRNGTPAKGPFRLPLATVARARS